MTSTSLLVASSFDGGEGKASYYPMDNGCNPPKAQPYNQRCSGMTDSMVGTTIDTFGLLLHGGIDTSTHPYIYTTF